jgi:hypothetical protein
MCLVLDAAVLKLGFFIEEETKNKQKFSMLVQHWFGENASIGNC